LVLAGATLVALLLSLGTRLLISSALKLPEDAELREVIVTVAENPARAPEGPSGRPSPGMARGDMPRSRGFWIDPIIQRSIFDSSRVGQANGLDFDTEGGRRSDLPYTLVATIVAVPSQFSSCLLSGERGDDGVQAYGMGDSIQGEATIVRIEQRRVVLVRDGETEYIDMAGEETRRSPSESDDDDEDVSKLGENRYQVDQSLVDEALENPDKLATQIRVIPHKGSDGEIDGYRLSGVRRGSLFDKLGVKNGDIVHGVNGRNLTSASEALDAYQSLQSDQRFSFDISRRSQRQTIEYEVR
jgi:type II secretion system protein C